MRHARIDLDRIGLVIAIETVAEAPDISERDDVVGLAEYTEHRALDAGDNVLQRLWEALADLPFALGRCSVPHQRGGDRSFGSEHERVPAGLAYAFDRNLGLIDLREHGELRERDVDILERFSVLELVPDIPAVQCILIRMLVIEIRRDAHKAVARMHEHDGRDLAVAGGHCDKRRQPPGAAYGPGHDLRHGSPPPLETMARLGDAGSAARSDGCQRALRQGNKRPPHPGK